MTDPIADMLTTLRNAKQRKHESASVQLSHLKVGIAEILKTEGYIQGYKVVGDPGTGRLRMYLKYINKQSVINDLQRVSKPGRRVYVGSEKIPYVKGGLGTVIMSTPKGLLTGQKSKAMKVGGEVLCSIW